MVDRDAVFLISTGLPLSFERLQDGRERASAEIVTTLIKTCAA